MAGIALCRLPSSKLLGYCHLPLRGTNASAGRDVCVTARHKCRGQGKEKAVTPEEKTFMQHHGRLAAAVWMLIAWTHLLSLSSAAEPSYRAAEKARVLESFKFDPDECAVLIPVRVGDKEYQFIVNTGTTWSVFNVSLRSHLGPRVGSVSTEVPKGDNVQVELYSPPNARVGSLPLTNDSVLCHDFTLIRGAFGYDVHGVVGMDFLRQWVIAIDFDRGRLRVLPPETTRDPEWGESIPFVYDAIGAPSISATAGANVRALFRVDTGDTGTGDLEDTLLNRLVGAHQAHITGDCPSVSASGIHSSRVARLSHFSLQSFRHEDLQFTSGKQNNLGLRYLSRYRVTIDFPNERIYLAKGKRFAGRDRGDACGLHYFFKPGRLEVEFVDAKSPAHAAGFRPKDVIVKLCGKPISELKPSKVDGLLTTEGKAVKTTVERGGKRMEISFTPKEYD